VKAEFKIHHTSYYINKIINLKKGTKYIISFGVDKQFSEGEQAANLATVIKIWDYESMIT
jgi:hypothetical protein